MNWHIELNLIHVKKFFFWGEKLIHVKYDEVYKGVGGIYFIKNKLVCLIRKTMREVCPNIPKNKKVLKGDRAFKEVKSIQFFLKRNNSVYIIDIKFDFFFN